MRSRKKLLRSSKLYVILDAQVNSYSEIVRIAGRASRAGAGIVQLRDKKGNARDILAVAKKIRNVLRPETLFIINDRPDMALLMNADGVHVGQNDLSVPDVRNIVGKKMLVGVSCQTLQHVKAAQKNGADYIGFGSVFKTQTKPERQPMNVQRLKKGIAQSRVPVFAIGGITATNIGNLAAVDVKRVAVCRDICLARDVAAAVKKFSAVLK